MTDFSDDDHKPEQPEQQPEREKEEIDPALPEKALDDLKTMLRGNGIKLENIGLKGCDGEVINFEAWEVFKIEHTTAEKHVNGREQGDQAGSYTDAQAKIKAYIERITKDPDVKKQTLNLLNKREDLGFGIDNQIIRLDRLNKKFVIHEPCAPCDSSGKILCQNCRGKSETICVRCRGERFIQCHTCHGAQFIETPKGRVQCNMCQGQGQIGCDMCRQKGEVPCPKCKATGRMQCHNCGATGWHTHMFNVNVKAVGNFQYDAELLPEDIVPFIDEYRELLILDDHAQIRIIEDRTKDAELEQLSKHDEYIIPYHVKLPWGDIVFSYKGKALGGKLFGYNPVILDMMPLVEKIIGPGLKALSQAAQGQGDIGALLGKAIRYRTIADAFAATIPYPPRRAFSIMRENYPFAISDNVLQMMIRNAGLAMKHLTKKPRMNGLAIGAVITAILYGAYFLGPLRGIIVAQTAASFPDLVPDLAMLLLGGTIITSLIQSTAAKTLHQALGKLARKVKLAPKMEESMLWGGPAALGLFALMLMLSFATGADTPTWLAQFIAP